MGKHNIKWTRCHMTIKWIGFCMTLIGMAFYFIVRDGEAHDYLAGKIVMMFGCGIIFLGAVAGLGYDKR